MLTFGSLFSGIGGFDLAFQQAGAVCAWQVEIDDDATSVLTRHFPDVPRYRDVCTVGGHNLAPVDCIVGGFPCQDLSVAGRRAGLAGERSGLWYEFHRVLAECRPGWVVIENVPGLLSSNGGADFAILLHGLVQLGYGVAWRVLDAQYFGVPQRRRRVFLVGHLGSGRAAEVLFKSDGGQGHPAPRRTPGAGLARSPEPSTYSTSGRGWWRDGVGALTERAYKDAEGGVVLAHSVTASAGHHGHSSPRGDGGDNLIAATIGGRMRGQDDSVANNLITTAIRTAQTSANGHGLAVDQAHTLDQSNGQAIAFAWQQGDDSKHGKDGRGRSWITRAGDYAAGLSRSRHDAVAGGFGVRRLTPLECERLQGFPDGWTAGQSDSARYRQLGNAVCVPVVRWLAEQIMRAA